MLAWLEGHSPRTFNTYLNRIGSFFRWCVKVGYLQKSPTDSIERIDERRLPDFDKPPVILNVEQCRRLLRAVLEHDRELAPYVAVGLFAGLRPEREAAKLSWEDIQDGMICVKGSHAKDRQRRYIPIHPTLAAWLALGGDLPVTKLRRRFEIVREKAGLISRVKVDGVR